MTRIRLCGPLALSLEGREVVPPGRQGRLLVAYLVVNRHRAVGRDELLDLLWPENPPADPGEALSALLSRLRRTLELQGRRELRLVLPDDAEIDLEVAQRALADDPHTALQIASGGFLTGDEAPWIDERRRDVGELRLRALEMIAATPDERAARELVEAAPFRESGHRLLMSALAAGGNVAEALRVYDDLRVRLREELGTAPGPDVQALHRELLAGGPARSAVEPARPAERRLVTVVCATADLHDPEDLVAAHARLRELFEGFGAAVRDPSLAVFGIPAHGDDPERAVRAALHACERGLAARAGVATGEAIVAADGTVTGAVTTAAERLHAAAAAGVTLADEATMRATTLEYEEAPPGWAASAAAPPRAPLAPLVGRDHELAALQALYARVATEGRPHLVTVVGQAGIGKTRLVDELVARVPDTVLRGRCLAYGEGITWWALREILWDACGIGLGDGAVAAAAKLRALVERLNGDDRMSTALAASAGIVLGDRAPEEPSPESVADEIGLAWPRLLSALAPAVVVIEDLHWAEAPLLELVEAIVGRTEGPLLLVATARPELAEARPGWGYRPGMSQVVLQPLSEGQTDELVDGLLPARDEALRRRAARKAEGNPFFAEELARHLETGGVPGEIPNTVRALLAARIDALPADERRVLRHAAVVGRTFWAPALEPPPAGEALRGLEARGFVLPRPASTLPGHTELSFVHGLTREVAYHSIPRADRCPTHAAVARWIEDRVGDRREEFIELLAYHYEAAARPADAALAWPDEPAEREAVRTAAVRALVEAGNAARRRMAVEQAARFADRALALAVDGERVAALELKGRSFHAAVRGDDALAAYVEAIAVADRAAASRLRGLAILLCTRYAGSFAKPGWAHTATALVDDGLAVDGDEPASFATGALRLGRYWGMRRWRAEGITRDYSMEDAKRDAVRAVEIAEEIRSSLLLAVALEGLTWLSFDEGHRHAAELGRRHLHAASVLADPVEAHESLTVAAMCFTRAGDFTRARAAAAEATEQAARLSPHRRLHAAAAEALACVPCGALDELRAATADVTQYVAPGVCSTGVLALAGRVLALHEAHDPAAADAVALLERVAPPERPLGGWGHTVVEIVRPAIGADAARERLEAMEPASDVAALRAEIPVRALTGDHARLRALVDEARERSGPAYAPDLAAFADWGEAALTGDHDLAQRAAAALEARGEHYTAARLLADLSGGFVETVE